MEVDSAPLSHSVVMFTMPEGLTPCVPSLPTPPRTPGMLTSLSFPASTLILLFIMLVIVPSVRPSVVTLPTSVCWMTVCLI